MWWEIRWGFLPVSYTHLDVYKRQELYKKKTVKMTTIYKNHSYYNSRVKNSIGKMYLQDIKTYHVQKFLNDLIDSGLAHGTVSNIRFMRCV